MSGTPTHLLAENVELSIAKFLNDKWAATCGYPVYFDDAFADPTDSSSITHWAEFTLLRNGASRGEASLCQLDFFALLGTKGVQQTTGFRLNVSMTKLVSAMQSAINPFTEGFRVYDFAGVTPATPNAAPVVTRGWLQIANSNGRLGMTNAPRRMPTISGMRRQMVDFRVLHVQDRPFSQVY